MPKLYPLEIQESDICTERPLVWSTIEFVHHGLALIDYPQFKAVIRATINCGDDYAAAAWAQFHGDRLNYAMSRHPVEQGYALINLAYRLHTEAQKEKP
jgi:hypothetical protein